MKSKHRAQVTETVRTTLAWLERRGTARNREGMARFGITAAKAYGVSSATMAPLVKRLRRDHDLALALWDTGWLEARILAAFVAEPARTTASQMDRWCRDFDNWAVCDSTCLHLFSRTPLAWRRVDMWSRRREEFVRRAGFALIASLAVHDKTAPDDRFLRLLPLIETTARDERNFVRKAVNWALRQIGKRNLALNGAAVVVARRLSVAPDASSRWVGKDALRELTGEGVLRRLHARAATPRAHASGRLVGTR
jgi:3-methyladenine DNA glycosylase AlkD